MRNTNWSNQNKRIYPSSNKNTRYYHQYKHNTNYTQDYSSQYEPYPTYQSQYWSDNYSQYNQSDNGYQKSYYNKNHYNGQSSKYNNYSQYEPRETISTTASTDSSNQPNDNTISLSKMINDTNGMSILLINSLGQKERVYKKQLTKMIVNHMTNQKHNAQQKTLKVAKSLTDINNDTSNNNLSEFNLKRNYPNKEELLRVKVTLKDDVKDLVIYKNDDYYNVVKSFVEQNKLPRNLIKPLLFKLSFTLSKIGQLLTGNLSKEDIDILNQIKGISKQQASESESVERLFEEN